MRVRTSAPLLLTRILAVLLLEALDGLGNRNTPIAAGRAMLLALAGAAMACEALVDDPVWATPSFDVVVCSERAWLRA